MKTIRLILQLILTSLTLLGLLKADDSWKIYDDTQVAVINVSTDPADLSWMYNNVESDSMHLAIVHFKNAWIDETIDSVGFRFRGNTSRYSQKKSFKLSFNTFIPGREFYGVDKLNINGEHNDPSIIRSKLCWDFFREIGLTASRAAHTALYINDIYMGLYISVEHVDDEFLSNHFADDSGELWKCLWPADLTYRGPNPEDYYPYYDAQRPYELKTNVDQYDYRNLAELIDIINNTPDELFADSLQQILTVTEVLKYFAINILCGGWDDYWFLKNNYYLYYEPALSKFHWIPYDYDNTFGVDWFSVDWAKVDPYVFANMEEVQGGTPGPRPLARRIMENVQYHNLYTHFLQYYRDNIFDLSQWESHLDSLKEKITPWVIDDEFRTLDYGFTLDDFHDSYSEQGYSNQHIKRGIKEFVNVRNNSLSSQLYYIPSEPIIYAVDWWPRHPRPQDSIHVTASVFADAGIEEVQIQLQPGDLTITLTYPMQFTPVPHTRRIEQADRWHGTIPPLNSGGYGSFNILAKDTYNRTQIFPRNSGIYIAAPDLNANEIVINEFLAKNDSHNLDSGGEYDDWLELYNPGSNEADLSGMYLTDNSNLLTKWQFPVDMPSLAAGGYILIWCDDDSAQSGWHTNFRLNADGEFIALVANDGLTIIDSITFGLQTSDISYGRVPDGSEQWQLLNPPTPGTSNPVSATEAFANLPRDYQLYQNYPNPFNPLTTIQYYLPQFSRVQIAVYDILGRKIKMLVDQNQSPGFRSVTWDATDAFQNTVSAGIYLYRFDAGGKTHMGKMILLK